MGLDVIIDGAGYSLITAPDLSVQIDPPRWQWAARPGTTPEDYREAVEEQRQRDRRDFTEGKGLTRHEPKRPISGPRVSDLFRPRNPVTPQ